MNRQYHFVSRWTVDAPIETVWNVLLDPIGWSSWWPGVSSVQVTSGEPGEVGGKVRGRWQALVGYSFVLELTITQLERSTLIGFKSGGDLVGTGNWRLKSDSSGTSIDITWDVETTKPWMNRYGRVLSPLFGFFHARLMTAGEQGLREYLRQN